MRELKNGMKKLFTTIFCLLMNLIPGKKFWAKEENTDVNKKRALSVSGGKRRNVPACRGSFACHGKNAAAHCRAGDLHSRYIQYLWEYIECLDKHKSSKKCVKSSYGKNVFEDTG